MRRARFNFLGFMLLVAAVTAPPVSAQKTAAPATARHSLWKVQSKNRTVYLLGSVHVLKAEDYPLPAVMESAYTNAAILVFETDMDAMEQPATQFKILSKAMLPEGETLAQQLSPAVYKQFTNHLHEAGLPVAMFEKLKPSLAALTLAVAEFQKLGLDPEYGIDKHFFGKGRKDGKQILPLETVEFQIGLVTDFTKEEGESLMKVTLDELNTTRKELDDLLRAWKTGDAVKLEKLLNEASRESPAIYKRLLTDRNERWVPQIEKLLNGDRNALVIVGAGHLVGDHGVVELLRKQGFRITQQ